MPDLHLSIFRADVTPPVGHPLCAGWQPPAVGVTDRLSALGIVLTGPAEPAVLCALDWCELSNRDYVLWREGLAEAAGTSPERVAVQCVHQHDAPWPDIGAQELVAQQDGLPAIMHTPWRREVIRTDAFVSPGAEAVMNSGVRELLNR